MTSSLPRWPRADFDADAVDYSEVLARVGVAAALGVAIGLERELRGHEAGIGTHALVAIGAAVFTVAGAVGVAPGSDGSNDPWRIAAQVASGIGFIGAGTIIQSRGSVKGLTTAAALWFAAGVGVAAGVGGLALAVTATAVALALLTIRELIPLTARQHRTDTAVVTVVHAERDALAAAVGALVADGPGRLSFTTEPSSSTAATTRWRTTINVPVAALPGVVRELQSSPAALEVSVEGGVSAP